MVDQAQEHSLAGSGRFELAPFPAVSHRYRRLFCECPKLCPFLARVERNPFAGRRLDPSHRRPATGTTSRGGPTVRRRLVPPQLFGPHNFQQRDRLVGDPTSHHGGVSICSSAHPGRVHLSVAPIATPKYFTEICCPTLTARRIGLRVGRIARSTMNKFSTRREAPQTVSTSTTSPCWRAIPKINSAIVQIVLQR